MITNPSHVLGFEGSPGALAQGESQVAAPPVAIRGTRVGRAAMRRKTGNALILAGSVITILGVVLYCAVSFAGGMNAELGDVLLRNVQPLTRATLGVLGLGTLVWLIGSFMYLEGAMEQDLSEDAGPME